MEAIFKRIQNKTSRDLNVVRIDNLNLRNLGLYLEEDFKLSYTRTKEVEEIYIPGRDDPYHKIKRKLPIEFEINFNIKESANFYARMENIEKFLDGSIGKVITFNNEPKGFKIIWYEIGDTTRTKGLSTVTIAFQCSHDPISLEN